MNMRQWDETIDKALAWNSVGSVLNLIDEGYDLNEPDLDGKTPIIRLVYPNIEALSLLLREGADPHARDATGWTALHQLCNGTWECEDEQRLEAFHDDLMYCFEMLMNKGVDVDATDDRGVMPLHLAVMAHPDVSYRLIERLLEKGASINTRNNDEESPLTVAARNDRDDSVDQLLAAGADPVRAVKSPAWKKGHIAQFGFMTMRRVEQRIPPVDPSTLVGTSLHRACVVILEGGASESEYLESITMVDNLIDAGMDVNANDMIGWAPIHYAASSDDEVAYRLIDMLLRAGADINAKNEDGNTALAIAVAGFASVDTVKLLLQHGADPILAVRSATWEDTQQYRANNEGTDETMKLVEMAAIEWERNLLAQAAQGGDETSGRRRL